MTSSFNRLLVVGSALLIFGVSLAHAQTPGAGRRGAPVYDLKSETTIKGPVESVETITGSALFEAGAVWEGPTSW